MGFMEDRSLRLSLVGQMVKNTSAVQDPWVRKIPWRRKCLPTPVFLPGEPCGRTAWWATVDGGAKSLTQLND